MAFILGYPIATFSLLLFFSLPIFAQGTATDQHAKRIAELEKRVTVIEQRLIDSQRSLTPAVQKSKGKTLWRTLERGMTKKQVEAILGEPGNITVSGQATIWSYVKQSSSSSVTFFDNVVYGWSEPPD